MGLLDRKVILVTGASSGLGRAAATAMAAEGGRMVLAARREDKGLAVVRSIKQAGGEAVFVPCDVTKTADVQLVVDRAIEQFGRLDCAVNNAGIAGPVNVPIGDVEEGEWDDVMNLNLRAVWVCMKFEIAAMLNGGGGSIVNVASIYGYKPSPICGGHHMALQRGSQLRERCGAGGRRRRHIPNVLSGA